MSNSDPRYGKRFLASSKSMKAIPESLAGTLLLAHPSLLDANFRRTVILLTAHSSDDGAMGVVVNRPVGQTLGEYDTHVSHSLLADIPLYYGGPVAADELILVAWKWNSQEGSFRLYFGINEAKAQELYDADPEFEFRGFLGHSGWGEDQLEAEIEEDSWVSMPLQPQIREAGGEEIWRKIISSLSPEMELLALEPEDPSLN